MFFIQQTVESWLVSLVHLYHYLYHLQALVHPSSQPPVETIISSTCKRQGWPSWTSLTSKKITIDNPGVIFTKQARNEGLYSSPTGDENPADIFEKTTGWFDTIQKDIGERETKGSGSSMALSCAMGHLSSAISGIHTKASGIAIKETIWIYETVFRSEVIDPEEIPDVLYL